ncbi:MAG: hypothetical protein R2734_15580 [Nocardioides sp.]
MGGFVITYGVLIVILLYLVFHFALTQTTWGKHVYAVGDDPRRRLRHQRGPSAAQRLRPRRHRVRAHRVADDRPGERRRDERRPNAWSRSRRW